MKSRLKYLWILVIAPVLLACNLSQLLGDNPNVVPTAQNVARQPAGQSVQPLPQMEGQVRQTVADFLGALNSDPSGAKATGFLSPKLQQQVSGGKTVGQVVGIQNSVPKFELSAVTFTPDASQATLDGTLSYQKPQNMRFVLVRSGDAWKIDSVVSMEGSAGYPSTPEEVVQFFLMAYQESPDQMSTYLSSARLAQLPPGGAVGMLNINGSMEGSMVQSAAVNPNPPSAAVTIVIRVGGKDVPRVFTLSQEKGQWKIDNIDPGK